MKNNRQSNAPQQLSLLAARDDLPLQFRLDDGTRRRGLAHIAQIRAQLQAHGHDSRRSTDRGHRAAA